MDQFWGAIASGVVLAILLYILLDLGLKPWRERRTLARVLRSEVEYNIDVLAMVEAMRARSPRYPVYDFRPATNAYDALVARLGELPEDVLSDILALYRGLNYLAAEQAELLSAELDSRGRALQARPGLPPVAFSLFDPAVTTTLEIGAKLLPKLDAVGSELEPLDTLRRPRDYLQYVRRLAVQRLAKKEPPESFEA
jgi:hypothetical protein